MNNITFDEIKNLVLTIAVVAILVAIVVMIFLPRLIPKVLELTGIIEPQKVIQGNQDMTNPTGPYTEQIIRIRKTIPDTDVLQYNSYDDFTGSSKKIATADNYRAVIRIGFNNPIDLTKLQGAIEVWQQICKLFCNRDAVKKEDYRSLAYGPGGSQWNMTLENGDNTIVDLNLPGDTRWIAGQDYVIRFKTEYIQAYCQSATGNMQGCKYIDKDNKFLVSPETAMIKFTT